MKKNLISIFLIAGAVALNLSMLGQASCAGIHAARQVNEAAVIAAQHASAFCVTHSSGHEVKAESEGRANGSGIKCGCAAYDSGVHLDFDFNVAAADPAPQGHAPQAVAAAVSIPANLAPVPQDRPPAPA